MKKTISILGIIILIALGYFFYQKTQENTPTVDSKKEVIKIGAILPLTGELSSYGNPIIDGINIALQNNNNEKYTFILDVQDSKGEAKSAVSGLNHLMNYNKINYFIGDVSSPSTLAMIPIIDKNKALIICPGASSPKLENISKSFIRNYPSSSSESRVSANFILDSLQTKSVGIVYVNNDFGIGLKDGFSNQFVRKGGIIDFTQSYSFGEVNFRNIITKITNSKTNVIYLGGNPKEMGHFVKKLREIGKKTIIVSNISFLQPDCLNIAGEASNGVIVPVAYYNPNDSLNQIVENFTKIYQKSFNNKLPSVLNAIGFDAATLIIEGVNKVGNNPLNVADYLRNLKDYKGALGNLSFENGEVSIPIQFKYINNGTINILNNIESYKNKYAN
jgi:branched-chain amino acid transport system substrate-binding protein